MYHLEVNVESNHSDGFSVIPQLPLLIAAYENLTFLGLV